MQILELPDGTEIEFEDGATEVEMLQAMVANADSLPRNRLERLTERNPLAEMAQSTLQTLGVVGSNLALMPFAGISALSAGVSPMLHGGEYSHERANNALDSVMSNAYSPTSEGSLEQLQTLAKLGEYAEIPSKYLGDTVTDLTGSAEAGTAAYMVPELLASLFPAKYGANAVRAGASNLQAPRSLNQALRDQAGMVAFHGSPHRFDKFDHSKMGTGEGAQAYGWGTYVAESPKVAKGYRDTLSGNRGMGSHGNTVTLKSTGEGIKNTGTGFDSVNSHGDYDFSIEDAIHRNDGDIDKAIAEFRNKTDTPLSKVNEINAKRADWLERNRDDINYHPKGSIYEVDLPDSKIDQMLDWDGKFNDQLPNAQEAIKGIIKDYGEIFDDGLTQSHLMAVNQGIRDNDVTLGTLLDTINYITGSDKNTARELKNRGIPGIKYLDGNSRADGRGTRNFVVFDENDMTILTRNGSPIE